MVAVENTWFTFLSILKLPFPVSKDVSLYKKIPDFMETGLPRANDLQLFIVIFLHHL
jgi:hypothetical protein